MIYLNLTMINPWHKEGRGKCRDYFGFDKQLTTHKHFETQLTKFAGIHNFFAFRVNTNLIGEDHAGPMFELEILGLYFHIKIYDTRHWDYDNAKWEVYEDESI